MKPYQEFSKVYDDYQFVITRLYASFLTKLNKIHAFPKSRILDIACGTGSLLKRISSDADMAIGIDYSESMLEVARVNCSTLPHVRFIQADFRDFTLHDSFDLIISSFDSFNYAENVSDLAPIFSSVSKHLSTNGYFIFDVVNELHFKNIHGTTYQNEKQGYINHIEYDSVNKYLTSIFNFTLGTEAHRQIPLEYEDVVLYLSQSGLKLVDVYSNFQFAPLHEEAERLIFVVCLEGS